MNLLFQEYPLGAMAIFGSYSRGENTDEGDSQGLRNSLF